MNTQQQKITIAEITGLIKPWTFGSLVHSSGCLIAELPDYLNDLNAMNEVEKWLRNHQVYRVLFSSYIETLKGIVERDRFSTSLDVYSANASKRAEAFISVFDKWKD